MSDDCRASEKPRSDTPAGEPAATNNVGAEVKTPALSEDARGMLHLISLHFKEKPKTAQNLRYWVVSLAPVLLVCLAPFAVLFFIIKNDIKPHYGSLNFLPVFAGCWAIFSVWITVHKGMGGLLLVEDVAGAAWLVLGLINVVAALGTLLVWAMS